MPTKNASDLEHLEHLVTSLAETTEKFTTSAQEMIASDHSKIELVYKFLFVGEPGATPPVPPFVISMQRDAEELSSFKSAFSRFLWIVIGIITTGGATLLVLTYNHITLDLHP